jgi:hypothetical protein
MPPRRQNRLANLSQGHNEPEIESSSVSSSENSDVFNEIRTGTPRQVVSQGVVFCCHVPHCGQSFKHQNQFMLHLNTTHVDVDLAALNRQPNTRSQNFLRCSICQRICYNSRGLTQHFSSAHEVSRGLPRHGTPYPSQGQNSQDEVGEENNGQLALGMTHLNSTQMSNSDPTEPGSVAASGNPLGSGQDVSLSTPTANAFEEEEEIPGHTQTNDAAANAFLTNLVTDVHAQVAAVGSNFSDEVLEQMRYTYTKGLFFLHRTWIPSLRNVTTKLIRLMSLADLNEEKRKRAVFAFLVLPGFLRSLLDIKTSRVVDTLRKLHVSSSPAEEILEQALELLPIVRNVQVRLQERSKHRRTSTTSKVKSTHNKIVKLFREHRYSAAMKHLEQFSASLGGTPSVTSNMDITQKIAAVGKLNPPGTANDILPPANDDPVPEMELAITADQVEATISKLPQGSANGISGWTYDILRQLYTGKGSGLNSDTLMEHYSALATFFNLIVQGRIPNDQWLVSRAVLLPKPDGGLRPLGIGETWYRLLNRCILSNIGSLVGESLLPLQLGCSIKGGCEIGARLAQVVLDSDERYVIIKTDFKNAFNLIPRKNLLNGVREYCPQLCKLFRWAYGAPSDLRDATGTLLGHSSTGCKQGDPLAFLLFCVGVQNCLINIDEKVSGIYTDACNNALPDSDLKPGVFGYADDFSIFCSWSLAPQLCTALIELTGGADLTLNLDKCNITVSSENIRALLSEMHLPFKQITVGSVVLGCPTGTAEYRKQAAMEAVASVCKSFPGLAKLELPAKVVATLLKFCISPRAGYLARVLDPLYSMDALKTLDAEIDHTICRTLHHLPPSDEEAAVIAVLRSLPRWLGGMAIPRYSWVAGHTSCLKSAILCRDFVEEHFDGTLTPGEVDIDIGSFANPAQPFLSHPVVAPSSQGDETAESRILPVERRNISDVEMAQYIAAFWHIHSFLLRIDCPDRAAWLLSSAHDYANSWLYVSRNSSSWFSGSSSYLTDKEYSHSLCNLLLIRSPNAMPLGSRCLCVVQHNLAPGRIPSNNPYHHLDCIATKCFRSFCHTEISRAVTHYIKKRIPNIAIAQTPHIQRRNTAQNNTQILMADLVVTPADRSGMYIDFTVGNPAAPSYYDTTDPNLSSSKLMHSTNRARELLKLQKYSTAVGYGLPENAQILQDMYRSALRGLNRGYQLNGHELGVCKVGVIRLQPLIMT